LVGPLATDVADPRFLTTAYAAMLVLLALGLSRQSGRLAGPLLVTVVLLSLTVNSAVRPKIVERAYWNYSNAYADSARGLLAGYTTHEVSEIWYVTLGSSLPEHWYFAGNTFFEIYGAPAADTNYVATANDVPPRAWSSPGTVILGEGATYVTDLKARAPSRQAPA
jgi:hypothetical protein